LIYSGIKMLFFDDDDANPENAVVRAVRRWIPVTSEFQGTRFFVTIDGKRHATPLLIVLVALETTDVLFATDSIPAILGVTTDAFIVYTSNIMAILGLRALYFALASLMDYFEYLRYGLAAVLVFIGGKMLLDGYYEIPTPIALAVLGGLLLISMLASVFFKGRREET
ncbi:MAG: TerC family protein, partial [Candidatus Eremiobacteraeota bacterium]|nr:TerC family protein [Candidatus Eremiobacteraeota bacterium]